MSDDRPAWWADKIVDDRPRTEHEQKMLDLILTRLKEKHDQMAREIKSEFWRLLP